jgi:hypothetical protein
MALYERLWLTINFHPVVILDNFRVCSEKLVIGSSANQSIVMVGRLRVVLDKTDGHVAVLGDSLKCELINFQLDCLFLNCLILLIPDLRL